MDITPLIAKEKLILTGYGEGGFKINGEFYQGSLILFPRTRQSWDIQTFNGITAESLAPVLQDNEVELLLLGTGAQMHLISPELRALFRARGIAVECMDTGAACRTYNILLAEERKVAAGLIAV